MTAGPEPHAWHIDEREYERHEQRRGRRFAFEALVPATTALVVIDMVPFFVGELRTARAVVPTVNALAADVRRTGGVVAWVVPAIDMPSSVEFYGAEVATRYRRSAGTGTRRERLWPEMESDSNDMFAEKSAASAFFPGRCDLHDALTGRSVDTVLVAGVTADVCCESSVRDASTLGYRVVMIADAVATGTDQALNATLRTVYRSFGDVRTSGDVSRLLGCA